MNEGESAGGGHQGPNPAPPAVLDRRSPLPISNLVTNCNNNRNQAVPSLIAIARNTNTNSNINSKSTITPRSFQQAFTQQQQQQQVQHLTTGTISNTQTTVGVQHQHQQQQQQQQNQLLHMPQTPLLRLTTSGFQGSTPSVSTVSVGNTKSKENSTELESIDETTSSTKRPRLEPVIDSVVGGVNKSNVLVSLLPATESVTETNKLSTSHLLQLSPSSSVPDRTVIRDTYSEYKKTVIEKFNENVVELYCLLDRGLVIMDVQTLREKPVPQLVAFSKANSIDQLIKDEKPDILEQHETLQPSPENIATIIGVNNIHTQQSQPIKRSESPAVSTNKSNIQQQLQSSGSSNSALPTVNDSTTTLAAQPNVSSNTNNNPSNITDSTTRNNDESTNALPQGAEIKIPAVGATPVAVSTKLPAAVVQLSQQGGTPLVPCTTGGGSATLRRNGSVSTPSRQSQVGSEMSDVPALYSSTGAGVLVPVSAHGSTATSGTSGTQPSSAMVATGSAQEFSVKAKQEVYVLQRIAELQREGLWSEKRLPKLQEPTRPKVHWDYLLEEMVWLAADFAQERKWKKAAAKKCARMVQKYFNDKANAAQKAEKAHELNLKRIASFISKDIKMFWSNVEKIVEYKHQTKLEEKRKKALDQHLSFIVDQTEKFSQQLTEGMNKSLIDSTAVSADPSNNSSRKSSPKPNDKNSSDDEFCPESASEDDEETIAKEEEEDMNIHDINEEIAALEKESQMEIDDVLNDLPKGYLESREKLLEKESSSKKNKEDESDSEFEANESSGDDEKTLMKQEEEEMDVDYKKEINELEADNNLTVEELMKKYQSKDKKTLNIDSDDDEEPPLDSDDLSTEESDDSSGSDNVEESSSDDDDETEQKEGLKSLLEETAPNAKDDMIKDAAALAESIQPKGNTLSSTNVVTPVPFLLKHTLREYQHIGLDWLVTMYERKLNGILADEMGLGKTIQTIALLAHLACVKGNWGPHLIVVPSSVMLNWEMEFKKWCPGFKILTYYGSQKERKTKRIGWTKPNAFHVCITSYKLVVQDQQSFRRKKWKYLILDEAQNIKNFKSQRWQLLLNFSTERRLLLTGTPLQNDLMELWSLMHFLMPYVFSSHREFKEWFSNPMTGMIEGNMEYNESLINRLHKVIRPFLLRRLKKEVEKQMPKKYEHVIMCRLSNRQRYLYDDFMSRTKTKETLQSGNLLSVINILMQLRKVCNHPNLFEVRPTTSPFQMKGISYQTPRIVLEMLDYDPLNHIDLHTLNLLLIQLELNLPAYISFKNRMLAPPRKLIEEIDAAPEPPPPCPRGKYKFYVRVRDISVQEEITTHFNGGVQVGASPAMRSEGNKLVPIRSITNNSILKRINTIINPINSTNYSTNTNTIITLEREVSSAPPPAKIPKLVHSKLNIRASNLPLGTSTNIELPTTSKGAIASRINRSGTVSEHNSNTSYIGSSALVKSLANQVKINKSKQNMDESTNLNKVENDANSELNHLSRMQEIIKIRKESRLDRLKLMATINKRRTDAVPIYGSDCRETIQDFVTHINSFNYSTWNTRGYTNCSVAAKRIDNWSLNKLIKSYETRCEEMNSVFNNFVVYVPPVCAPRVRLYVQNFVSTRMQREREIEFTITREISPKLGLLHPITSAMRTQFPDTRLIQYDCGKLQTLAGLLKDLKSGQHRVLIFTQMTKMLDVLEAFLNYHGHIYLRLDGSTRIEQRQVLMERFNGDKKIFCFILSTRSGGVGVNLTGADTVIFYDSDWNPTMDAQAQDRCHRIGQTRDVHIYRLISEKTIEVNILKKANQKRMLSDMAIEGGNFDTTYFKTSTIKDLFNMEQNDQVKSAIKQDKPSTSINPTCTTNVGQPITNDVESQKRSLRAYESALAAAEDEQDVEATKIAKAEVAAELAEFDESIPIDDVVVVGPCGTELSKVDNELRTLMSQLTPIERYAMRFVEETGAAWTAELVRVAEEQIEAQKREWEANRLAALQKEEEMLRRDAEADDLLTYSRKDATNQVWISSNSMEQMPMWCPPTPPQDDNDVYIDYSLTFMYELDTIPEIELPPVYVKKEHKRSRTEAGFHTDGRRPNKIRKEDTYFAPRSLFDRPSAAIARIRRDLKSQRYRGVFKPNVQIPGLKPQIPPKTLPEPEGMAEWSIFEDMAILNVLINTQGLPCNLMILSPGHTPNWDLVAEVVNTCSKTFRSAKQCRWRYEAVIQPREEGKLVESPKKQKKIKNVVKADYLKGPLRYLRTTQMFINDNNTSFTKFMRSKFDCLKAAYLKKAPPPKRQFSAPSTMNPKHLEVLHELGVTNYDQPISPLNIAVMKVNKYREKQRSHLPPPPPPATGTQSTHTQVTVSAQTPQPSQQTQLQQQQQQLTTSVQQHQLVQATQQQPQQIQELVQQQQNVGTVTPTTPSQQLQIQHISNANVTAVQQQQQPTTAIVLQHSGSLSQQLQQQTSLATTGTVQTQSQVMRGPSGTTQILKAIVAPQSGLISTGQMITQQVANSGTQHVQLQQSSSGNLVGTPASVSVVLTTPVQTLSSNVQQTHHSQQASSIVSNSTQVGSIVQTLPQSLPQVVSVSQLANVGTVLTTSSSAGTVTTLNTSALRAQRIVAATAGTLQDVVLQQRSGNPSPTIVSMSSLGQSVTPAQFQAAQLRLASMSGTSQQVVTKSIPVSSLQQSAKLTPTSSSGNQQAHIQLYRQRQQLKVLQTGPTQGNQTVQTASGQTALLNAAGTIIQGNLMQSGTVPATVQVQGQKVSVASVPSSSVVTTPSGVVTSVATVQVSHNPGRAQFIKQVAGKQTITRQVGESDMLLVKRQVIGGHSKAQVLQQGQLYATGSTTVGGVQIQQTQLSSTGNVHTQAQSQTQQTQVQQITPQQIATLVKTSSGAVATSTNLSGVTVATGGQPQTVNMALSQLKPGGQIKVTMANQSQMRQLHMQQQLGMPRKISRMTQIAAATQNASTGNIASGQQANATNAQLNTGATITAQKSTGTGGVQAQLLHIQNSKSLPSSVTVQQIQQVMRQGQQGTLATTGLVLGKTSVGRVIPVSVASQSNQRQTIQVVSAASAQAIAAGNIRAHVASGQIKVASTGGSQTQSQQALITAIQQQAAAQQSQRHASPVRIQTTAGGNIVAVVQQQALQQQQNVVGTNLAASSGTSSSVVSAQGDVMTITQTSSGAAQQQQQQTVQPTTTQQVRTLVKKKIMQIRSEKE